MLLYSWKSTDQTDSSTDVVYSLCCSQRLAYWFMVSVMMKFLVNIIYILWIFPDADDAAAALLRVPRFSSVEC